MTKREEVIEILRGLTDKQLVDLFYDAVRGRYIYQGEENLWDAHLVLANAVRDRTTDGSPWRIEMLCQASDQQWPDDAPLCQHGEHCGIETVSWAKRSRCPVCGGEVYGT